MKIIVGLGNPGKKYEKTRHNIGSRVVEEFQKKNNFPDFKLLKKFKALISEGEFNDGKIILAKPQTFMNLSGKAVKLLIKEFPPQKRKIKPMGVILRQLTNLWVVHDDIDLPLGKIRISVGRGSAGHKGVKSIIDELDTKNFVRFRIGIKPEKIENRKQKIEKFVLKNFTKEEEKIIKEVIEKTVEVIKVALIEGVEKAMSEYNK